MTDEVREYIDSQEEHIKAEYEVLKGKGYLGILKDLISLEERREDLKDIARLINRESDIRKEICLGI